MSEPAQAQMAQGGLTVARAPNPYGEWVVTIDVEGPRGEPSHSEPAVRGLAVAVAGTRTYVAARPYGYSFTAIVGTTGTQSALAAALDLLELAQQRAGLPTASIVCAEVTLVGERPVPTAEAPGGGCENCAP